MRKVLSACVLVFVVAILTGCPAANLQRENAYHDGVKQYALESGLLEEYDKYIDADPSLKPNTKKIRKQTSAGFRALIATQEEALKKDND